MTVDPCRCPCGCDWALGSKASKELGRCSACRVNRCVPIGKPVVHL